MFYFQEKVYQYWPGEHPLKYADLIVGKTKVSVYESYTVREFNLTNSKVRACNCIS